VEIRRLGLHLMRFMALAQPVAQQLQTSVTSHWTQKNGLRHVWPNFRQQEIHSKCSKELLCVMQSLLNNIEPNLSP
jgi:hypothetical protein